MWQQGQGGLKNESCLVCKRNSICKNPHIEFGFLDGKLRLFQIRPFLESRQARGSAYLVHMDDALKSNLNRSVNMQEVPAS